MELSLGGSADVTSESSVRNAVSVLKDILKVLDGSLKIKSLHSSCSFISVLEVSSEISNSSLSRYKPETGT